MSTRGLFQGAKMGCQDRDGASCGVCSVFSYLLACHRHPKGTGSRTLVASVPHPEKKRRVGIPSNIFFCACPKSGHIFPPGSVLSWNLLRLFLLRVRSNYCCSGSRENRRGNHELTNQRHDQQTKNTHTTPGPTNMAPPNKS